MSDIFKTKLRNTPKCEICGELMPEGEEMFLYHGYSGDCPKPPLPRIRYIPVPEDLLRRLGGYAKPYNEADTHAVDKLLEVEP